MKNNNYELLIIFISLLILRRDDRGGYDRRDDRGGYDRRDDRGGYDRRDDRGGYDRRDDRGGSDRRDDRGGSERRDDRQAGDRRDDRGHDDRRYVRILKFCKVVQIFLKEDGNWHPVFKKYALDKGSRKKIFCVPLRQGPAIKEK